MELFNSSFDKQNKVTLFFVWLKSRIEQICSVLCLVRGHINIESKKRGEYSHPIILVEREHSNFLW
jgi:hypothetical protein